MGLRDIGETLPPGFRFNPSDEELVCHYLYKKIANEQVDLGSGTLVEIDLHTCEPWHLPDVAKLNSNEWYFFSFRDRKYATGYRANRATVSGYWKATGKDREVVDPRTRVVVGMRKTLVFYKNRAPNGIKTGFIMHEFRLENPHVPPKEDWVLCRVFNKSRCEDSNKLSPHNNNNNNFYEYSTAGATSPILAASPTNEHALASVYQNITSFSHSPSHNQHQNPSTSLGLTGLGSNNFNEANPSRADYSYHDKLVETKCDADDYGFLFDMSFDIGMPSSLGDMRFDDNGSVFI